MESQRAAAVTEARVHCPGIVLWIVPLQSSQSVFNHRFKLYPFINPVNFELKLATLAAILVGFGHGW